MATSSWPLQRGLDLDVVLCGSAVAACGAAGSWQCALSILGGMEIAGVQPNTTAYNSALGACEKGARWAEALQLLQIMCSQDASPDIVSYRAVAGACEAAGRCKEVETLCQGVTETLRKTQCPQEVLCGLSVLAQFGSEPGGVGKASSQRAVNRGCGLLGESVPKLSPREVGTLLWAMARLRATAPTGLLQDLRQRALSLESVLPWQSVGHVDYALRSLYDAREVPELRDAGSRAFAEVSTASARENSGPASLLLSLTGFPTAEAGSLLVVDDIDVAEGLRASGCAVQWWGRMSVGDERGRERPPKGARNCLCAVVRLSGVQSNSGGASLRLAVAGAATVLSQGAPLWLCGSEDEGIGDAAAALQHFFTKAEEIAQDGRSRVLRAYRCDSQPKSLEEFSSVVRLTLSEVGLSDVDDWEVWPGLFAGGTLDVMTAFLLRRLVRVCVSPGAKVLDFCCGNGAIAQAVVQLQPSAEVHLADADALAVRAACRNVPAARHGYLGDSWQGVPSEVTFDWIVSNPPVHRRRQDDFGVLAALVEGAARRLRPGGRLWIVAQVHVPVGPLLEKHDFKVRAESDGRFVLWRARTRVARDRDEEVSKKRKLDV